MPEKEVDGEAWLKASNQRKSVALSIQRPMAGSEITCAAQEVMPAIGRWDVSKILKGFVEKGLIYCINPEMHSGKLFWFTDYGRQKIGAAFHCNIAPKSDRVDWRGYSFVVVAPLRALVLLEAMEVAKNKLGPQTCAAIRRRLLMNGHPMSIYHVMRAVYELRSRRFLRCIRYTRKRHLRMYSITLRGRAVSEELRKK